MVHQLLSLALAAGITLSSSLGAATEQMTAAPAMDTLSGPDPLVVDEEQNPKTFDITITVAGDVMVASYKGLWKRGNFSDYAATKDPSYFLGNVSPIFQADDLTIVNLENVLTDRKLKEAVKNSKPAYWYWAPTSNTNILTCASVEAVSLANNHTGDYGPQGREDTIAAVEKAGLLYGTEDRTIYYEKDGFTIAVICHGLWYESEANDIVRRIQEASELSDFQIVFYHGGAERVHRPEKWRIRASRKLVDAGADLVIGNHPHVIQPRETYQGVDILYSMGNFCFGDEKHAENRTILYSLKLTVNRRDGTLASKSAEILPCYVYTGASNTFDPAVIEDPQARQRVLDFMDWRRNSPL